MVDKEQTPPPPAVTETTSSPLTPNPKCARMSSTDRPVEKLEKDVKPREETLAEGKKEAKEEKRILASTENVGHAEAAHNTESAAATEVAAQEPVDEEDELEADDDADSAFGGSENSESTSITSSIAQGIIENGRRYQAKREGEYWAPADEKQFESMEAGHIVALLVESKRDNPLFLSPIPDTVQNILDIGTGTGIWAKEVADMFPSAVVHGVDLAPPPHTWVPPNCKLEVDDVLKPWDFSNKFDFVHLRDMFGCFTDEQWRLVYKQAYNNMTPGAWIEQLETDIVWRSDDGTLAAGSHLDNWGKMFFPICEKIGKPADTYYRFKSRIEAAGFTNVHEKLYKIPFGDWVKNPILKEAGRYTKAQFLEGMEGYVMYLLTRFGEPTPWQAEEVQVFLAKVRQEINDPKLHAYYYRRRVWAQKPYDEASKSESKIKA